MKLSYTTKDGRLTVEFEADTQTELWEELAAFQEVFENRTCTRMVNGKLKTSDNTVFRVRKNKDEDKFYEMVCLDRDPDLFLAKKAFSVHKTPKGYMYWPVKDKEGNFRKEWTKYNKDTDKEE